MFRFRTTILVALAGATLSACTEAPTTPGRAAITPDPILTKYDSHGGGGGGGGCPGGGQQGTAGGGGGGEECLPDDYPQTPPKSTGQPRSGGGGNPGGGNQGGGGNTGGARP